MSDPRRCRSTEVHRY